MQQSKFKRIMKEEVRLSPATLTIMTEAHKVLSEETHGLAIAAAELFRRCEQLQFDLKDQIKKANDVALRVEAITGTDSDDGPVYTNNERVEKRIEKVQSKQKEITDRINAMKKKVARGTSQELSDKEKAWAEEVKILESKILPGGADQTEKKVKAPWARYEQAERLRDELLEQVKDISVDEETVTSPNIKVPSDIRKAKMNQIMNLLDRESALVEAAKSRLERLSLSS
jgi:nucleoporin NUP82